jgi:antitoxin component of MazEF toxin-antitoxin module
MKLQKNFAYQYADKPRYKYLITIPEETIQKLGWEAGSELNADVKNEKLVVEFVSKPSKKLKKEIEPKMIYDEFKNKIKELLESKEGLTWTEIRDGLKLPQIVPNNKWVKQMESDIGLIRVRDSKGIVWRIQDVRRTPSN